MQRLYANRLIYGAKIWIYNIKNKLQAIDFTPAERNLAGDSGGGVTAKSYCPDPVREDSGSLQAAFAVCIWNEE